MPARLRDGSSMFFYLIEGEEKFHIYPLVTKGDDPVPFGCELITHDNLFDYLLSPDQTRLVGFHIQDFEVSDDAQDAMSGKHENANQDGRELVIVADKKHLLPTIRSYIENGQYEMVMLTCSKYRNRHGRSVHVIQLLQYCTEAGDLPLKMWWE